MKINPEALRSQAVSLHEVFGKPIPEVPVMDKINAEDPITPDWRHLRRTLDFTVLHGDVIKRRTKHRVAPETGSRPSGRNKILGRIMEVSEMEGMGGDYHLEPDTAVSGDLRAAGAKRVVFGDQDFMPVTLGQIAPVLQRLR